MLTAPFPYFGGKRRAAPRIWQLLGDVGGYVEPFAGSLATLLARPHPHYQERIETVNEWDGNITNLWRAIKHAPAETAKFANAPVTEIELFSYKLETAYHERSLARKLAENTEYYDARLAGHTLYALCHAIGSPWGGGPWHLVDTPDGRRLVNTPGGNHSAASKPLVGKPSGGAYSHTPPPVGVSASTPKISGGGAQTLRGFKTRRDKIMARLIPLTRRLETVRILNGDWSRLVTPSVLSATRGNDRVGVFLDPPYAVGDRVYVNDENQQISNRVREWCKTADPTLRIILCGYDKEHDELLDYGWSKETSLAGGSGYGNVTDKDTLERIWISPSIQSEQAQPLF